MRLKQLEIKGFKSFANQTIVNFEEDVIGIVGPNGSGKSNIVDAIRWVLGEQKGKELRLDKMSSVLFNGTKKRKASGVASVSLTFENTKNLLPTEYNLVTITRMLYRSGESEYRLNGVQCRLKDITSLLLDTGIGSNSYAIIALGMVDDILEDKDNSRRRMFEQAAGVSKYKQRKRETLNKLSNTEGDLDRIEDLLHEIKANLVSLEKQAKRARRYREIKDKYRELSVQLATVRVGDLREQHATLTKQITASEDNYRAAEISVTQLEATLERERKDNVDKERTLSEKQRELNEITGRLRELESDKQMLAQREEFIGRNREKLRHDIERAGTTLTELATSITGYRERLADENAKADGMRGELTAKQEAAAAIRGGHAGVKSKLDEGIQEQQRLERSVFELEKRRAINSNQIDNYAHQRERNEADVDDRRAENELLETQMTHLAAEEKTLQARVTTLENAEEQRRGELEKAEAARDELKNELTRVNRGLDAKRNEYQLTKSMIENLEGFPESIRFLSQSKEWAGRAPLLSDLLLVDADDRVAIENYLEGYLNYYVTTDLAEAREAVQLLSRSQKGKANFFLLDAVAGRPAPADPALLPAGTRAAAACIKVEPKYRALIDLLLSNVLISDSDELPAGEIDGYTVLARSGRYIRRPISLSGGSVGLFEGKKIGRKKNLELLEKDIAKAEAAAEKLNAKFYEEGARIEELRRRRVTHEIQEAQRALNKVQQQRAGLLSKLENFNDYARRIQEKNEELSKQSAELVTANERSETDLTTQRAAITELRERLSGTDEDYRRMSEELSEAAAAYNEQNIAVIRQQNAIEALQRELDFKVQRETDTEAERTRAGEQLEAGGTELATIQGKTLETAAALEKGYEEKRAFAQTLSEAEQAYYQARGGINELEDGLRKKSRERQDLQTGINQLKEKFTDVKFKLSGISERIRIEFNVELGELLKEQAERAEPYAGDLTELELKVERLRGRIGNYGEINPLAVEAYDEMQVRHETITAQRDDILAAKESLMATLGEIEEQATVRFLDAFGQARIHFIEVFRSLFTADDNCDLILLDPENPLESKIEIVAKPKGKRPQTISQLSGGEKTLTATALLFALYLLKPAPFCIFDEVDAPLDDANITKFNRIIKKFSQDSQFIIVTHNKLTMAAVDTIYGVHMAQQGVSAVTAVDFREFELSGKFEAVAN